MTRSLWKTKIKKPLSIREGGNTGLVASGANREKDERGKFEVYLQPQINLQTGVISGAEALIRRRTSDDRIEPPASFISFLEKEGSISIIDLFVLETVCKYIKEWREQNYSIKFKIAINCSRITLSERFIVERMKAICDSYSVDPSQIVIEITETINAMDDESLIVILQDLKSCGFSVSLDDFGTGFSNLETLLLFDFDELKIDKTLIDSVTENEKAHILIRSTLFLCKNSGSLTSIAEGIETKEQYETLCQLGCTKGQGYYFDKPLPIEIFFTKYIDDDSLVNKSTICNFKRIS